MKMIAYTFLLFAFIVMVGLNFVVNKFVKENDPNRKNKINSFYGYILLITTVMMATLNLIDKRSSFLDFYPLLLLPVSLYLIRSSKN